MTAPALHLDTPRGRWVIAAAVLGSAVAFIDGTVVNAALPESSAIQITRQARNESQSAGKIQFTFHPPAKPPELPPAVKKNLPIITFYYVNPEPEKAKQMLVDIAPGAKLAQHATFQPNAPAVSCGDITLTYAEPGGDPAPLRASLLPAVIATLTIEEINRDRFSAVLVRKMLDPKDEGREAGQPVSCIPLYGTSDARIIDKTAIIYDTGRTIYVNRPLPQFGKHAWSATANVAIEPDGIVRHYSYGETLDGGFLPSVGALLGGNFNRREQPFKIDFSIDAASLPTVSYVDVLRGNFDTLKKFKHKKIIIGATAIELGDRFNVPNGHVVPGATLQALAVESIAESGHMLLHEQPQRVAAAIMRFVAAQA